jgi:hypothetical protein
MVAKNKKTAVELGEAEESVSFSVSINRLYLLNKREESAHIY